MALTREEAIKKLQAQQVAAGVQPDAQQPITESAIQAEMDAGPGIAVNRGEVMSGGEVVPGTAMQTTSSTPRGQQTLAELQERRAISQLRRQREQALSGLTAEEEALAPVLQAQRTAAQVQSQRGARSFNEYLAQRGLAGVTPTGEGGAVQRGITARNIALQQRLGDIGTVETQALADIARRRTAAGQEFEAGVFDVGLQRQQSELQQQLAQQQAQAEAAQAAQQLQAQQEFQLQLRAVDAELANARAEQDFGREQQLLQMKNQLERGLIAARTAGTLQEIAARGTTTEPIQLTPTEQVVQLQTDVDSILSQAGTARAREFLQQNYLPLIVEFGEEQGQLIYNQLLDRIGTATSGEVIRDISVARPTLPNVLLPFGS